MAVLKDKVILCGKMLAKFGRKIIAWSHVTFDYYIRSLHFVLYNDINLSVLSAAFNTLVLPYIKFILFRPLLVQIASDS
jgi:hypothetical protein